MPSDLRTVTYTPASVVRHPKHLLLEIARDLKTASVLGWKLALRDLSAQFRQTILGFLWVLILPIATTATWLFLNFSGVVEMRDTRIPYAAYVLIGSVLWSVFMDAVNAPLLKATAAKQMLAKLNFPRESLILSGVYQTLINAGIKTAVLLIALPLLGVGFNAYLLLFPLGLLVLTAAGTAAGLLLTPPGLLYNDIGKAIPLLMQFFMFITPAVIPIPREGVAEVVFRLNPLTPLIEDARNWICGYGSEMTGQYLLVTAATLAILAMTMVLYRIAMPILIERMSA